MKALINTMSAFSGFLILPAFAFAQLPEAIEESEMANPSGLREIVVNAQKRNEILQEVPISIVALSGERLVDANLTKLDELQSYVPNLTVTETGIGSLMFMRGIGSGINQGFEQSVGTYVDGIYRGRAQQSRMPFLDLERVEVLRGPQSILFGKHTIAGALNLTTAKPSNFFDAEFTTLYEPEFDNQQFSGFVSGPLSETVNGRLAMHVRETDGWVRNLTLDRDEAQRQEHVVRGTLEWTPNATMDFSFKAETSRFDVIGRQMEITGDRKAETGPFAGLNYGSIMQMFGQDASVGNSDLDFQRSSNGDYSNNNADEFVLTANYYGWGDLTLTSITGYSTYQFDELCDCDYTGANVFSAEMEEDFSQFSQEFRLASPGDQVFDYLLGLSYHNSDLSFFDTLSVTPDSVLVPVVTMQAGAAAGSMIANTATPRTLTQDTATTAAYAQATWNYNSRTRFGFGARLTHEERQGRRHLTLTDAAFNPLSPAVDPFVQGIYSSLFHISNHDLAGSRSRTRFLPSFNVQYDLNKNAMAYFTASRGEKSGGFDARSNNAPANGGSFEFEGEQADTLEVGTKMSLAGGDAEINAALYYTEFDRMQVSTFDGVLGFNVGNAARAVSQGVELDGRWRVSDHLMLSGSLAMSDFEFKEYSGQCYFGQQPDAEDGINCSYAGRGNQFQADYSGILSADYRRPLANRYWFSMTMDMVFSDDYLLTATQDPRSVQQAYTKFNGRIALASADNKWELALIGKNLSDENIQSFGGNVPLAGSTFGAPGFYGFVEQSRSVAARVTFRY